MKKLAQQNPPIIIIGMHRSGTTLTTKILEKIGVNIGKSKDDNYESLFFQDLNKMLMNMAGSTWDSPVSMRLLYDNSKFSELAAEVIDSKVNSIEILRHAGIKEYIKYFVLSRESWTWGWKDPRNVFTIRTWMKVFPNAKILHVYRHGIDIAASLKTRSDSVLNSGKIRKNRHQMPFFLNDKRSYPGLSSRCSNISGGMALWDEYMSEALAFQSEFDGDFLSIKYEDLLQNSDAEIQKIIAFLNLEVSEGQIESVCKFINPNRAYAYKETEYLEYEEVFCDVLKKFGY